MTNNLTASASTSASATVKPLSSIREIVDKYCVKPVRTPTGPGVIPRLQVALCANCERPADIDDPSSVVICDVCEEVFHHRCARLVRGRYAARIQEWMCGSCYAKRLEITLRQAASEVEDLRNHNVGDNSSDAEIRRQEDGHSGPEKSSAKKRTFDGNMADKPDAKDASENSLSSDGSDGGIPDWAKELEPVREIKPNAGSRIRICVNNALEKNPPNWAKKILQNSIKKGVYKSNACGKTKKAVQSVLARVMDEELRDNGSKKKAAAQDL